MEPATRPSVAVVVLTGGASSRLGQHKPALDVGGRAMVARVLDAVGPRPALVVGRPEGVPSGIRIIADEPSGQGPAAAVASGLAALTQVPGAGEGAAVVVVLAGDLPFLTSAHLDRLERALEDADLAVTIDADGRRNWLCAAWRAASLAESLRRLGDPAGRSMRDLADGVRTAEIDDVDGSGLDVDTPADLDAARRRTYRR